MASETIGDINKEANIQLLQADGELNDLASSITVDARRANYARQVLEVLNVVLSSQVDPIPSEVPGCNS